MNSLGYRLTIRRLMILVVLSALACTPFGLFRWMRHKSQDYGQRMLAHHGALIKILAQPKSRYNQDLMKIHLDMIARYSSAMHNPFVQIADDPIFDR